MELLQGWTKWFSCKWLNANPIKNSESFKYKSIITGKTSNANQKKSKKTKAKTKQTSKQKKQKTVKSLSKEIQRLTTRKSKKC